jgi:hypothetical protein
MGLGDSADLAAAVEELNRQIDLPASLGALGVTPAHIPELVEHAVGDIAGATNPRPVAREDYWLLFAQAIG